MNNDHYFLRYKVSCGTFLRFSLLSQCTFTLHLGELPLPQRCASIFCSETHPLAYGPNQLLTVLGKYHLVGTTHSLAENPGILSYIHSAIRSSTMCL